MTNIKEEKGAMGESITAQCEVIKPSWHMTNCCPHICYYFLAVWYEKFEKGKINQQAMFYYLLNRAISTFCRVMLLSMPMPFQGCRMMESSQTQNTILH